MLSGFFSFHKTWCHILRESHIYHHDNPYISNGILVIFYYIWPFTVTLLRVYRRVLLMIYICVVHSETPALAHCHHTPLLLIELTNIWGRCHAKRVPSDLRTPCNLYKNVKSSLVAGLTIFRCFVTAPCLYKGRKCLIKLLRVCQLVDRRADGQMDGHSQFCYIPASLCGRWSLDVWHWFLPETVQQYTHFTGWKPWEFAIWPWVGNMEAS